VLPRTDPPPAVGDPVAGAVAGGVEVDHEREDPGVRVEHVTAAPPVPAEEAEGAGAAEEAEDPGRTEGALTDRELAVLALERRHYRHQGAKEQAVRDELDLSATRYYQVLNTLLDDPAALAHDPVLVGRLRRLRDARAPE